MAPDNSTAICGLPNGSISISILIRVTSLPFRQKAGTPFRTPRCLFTVFAKRAMPSKDCFHSPRKKNPEDQGLPLLFFYTKQQN